MAQHVEIGRQRVRQHLQAASDLDRRLEAVRCLGLMGARAHRHQVPGRIAGVVAHPVDGGAARVLGRVIECLAGDRAVRGRHLAQVVWGDLEQFHAAPAQPGMQPQLQPLAHRCWIPFWS